MIKVKDGYAKLVGTTASGSASHILLSNGGIKAVSDILNSNVASATKLQTARTIWGQWFDGTANVIGTAHIGQSTNGTATIDAFGGKAYYGCDAVADGAITSTTDAYIVIDGKTGNIGAGTTNAAYKLDVNGEFRCASAIRIQPHAEGWADAFFNYSSTKGYLLSARGGETNKNFRLYNYTGSSYNALIDVTE
jgi:hypothetical protein